MMNNNEIDFKAVVFPPNKQMEPRAAFSNSPKVFDALMFLDFNSKGNCIIGCSDISGTFWEGTLLYFNELKSIHNFDYRSYYVGSTASDGKFITDNTIALAEDTGDLKILSIDEDNRIRALSYFKVMELIPQLGTWHQSKRILAASRNSISVWEADDLDKKPIELFENYHLDKITCVDTFKQDISTFVTGSRDRLACTWDLRNSSPASVLYNSEFSSITSVCWDQEDENSIAVGTEAGDVYFLDKREPNDFLAVLHCFDAPINRMAFNTAKELAVCGDTNKVLVLNNNDNFVQISYKSTEHKDYVKDVKWHNECLYSCGFEKSVIKHNREV